MAFRGVGGAVDVLAQPQDITFLAHHLNANNNVGEIVGTSWGRPTLWSPELAQTDLGDFGALWANAVDINEHSQILIQAGYRASDYSHEQVRTMVYKDGHTFELPALSVEAISGQAINNLGMVVGRMTGTVGAATRAFLWSSGSGFTDLGAAGSWSEACDVNDQGTIVGRRNVDRGPGVAFAYTDADGAIDLQDRLTNAPAWNLYAASDINNAGQILAVGLPVGVEDNYWRVVLLTPVPEPTSCGHLLPLLAFWTACRRCRAKQC